jgi:glycosyltransferase involved in cell wall biosynthesis
MAARRAAAIITVSNTTKEDIVQILGIPADKVHVIYEAPSADFHPLPENTVLKAVRQSYNLPKHFILFVGTLEPRKNLVRLLQAYEKLHKQVGVPHHLIIAGAKGWKTHKIYATLEQLQLQKVVHLPGYIPQEDLPALFNLADVLALPSLYEGFGLPVVEAMACGTPVVTSRCGALAEVAGEAVEYVEPTEVESIVMGLRHVLMNPERQQELRSLGLTHVRRYNWEHGTQQTLEVYRQAINAHAASGG